MIQTPVENYGDLKEAIAEWLNHDDLTDQIPHFIALAERNIFRRLRTPINEQISVFSDSVPITQIPLPNDYLQARTVLYGGVPMKRMTDIEIQKHLAHGEHGFPCYFGRIMDELFFYPIPTSIHEVELYYHADYSGLKADTDTNLLLLQSPDLYIFGSLIYAEPFLVNDERINVWKTMFEAAMRENEYQQKYAELSGDINQMKVVA